LNFKQAKGISVKDFLRRQENEVYATEVFGDVTNSLNPQQFNPVSGKV